MQTTQHDPYQDIREAVRDLCIQFPGEYFRQIDDARGYPDAFVDALTKAGWLAALIPQEYGGSGLGLTEASIIMEEINRAGGNSGACIASSADAILPRQTTQMSRVRRLTMSGCLT